MYKLIFIFFASLIFCYENKFEGAYPVEFQDSLHLIARFLPEDPVIFEAGGHYGVDTLLFAKKWPKAQIYTFEPNPHAFDLLREATRHLRNVHPYNMAVNDYNGVATLYVCYGTTGDNPIFEGASSLLEASEYMKVHYQGPRVTVPCVILDDWALKEKIDHIDFMWLDLEGLELQILAASPRILDTVKVIYAETNFQSFRVGTTLYNDLKTFLERHRFKLIAHWYAENFQGNAIFLKKESFEN